MSVHFYISKHLAGQNLSGGSWQLSILHESLVEDLEPEKSSADAK
jgi:hypothetical protein